MIYDNNNWKPYCSLDDFGNPRPVRGIYEVLVNDDASILCFKFRAYCEQDCKTYPDELVQNSFEREIKNLEKVKQYPWAPEILEIDYNNKCVFLKWYGKCCDLLYRTGVDYGSIAVDWKQQLEQIVKDLHKEELYKVSFYPGCFYFDSNNILHTFMFYTVSTYAEQPIDISFYETMLNEDRLAMIRKLAPTGKLDMKLLYEQAFKNYIKWPEDPLPAIYDRVYG
jgi:hypothetical protein